MSATATFATFGTSNGATIHRLPLEVFPGFWGYAYLVLTDDLRILIDTGSGTEASHANLTEGLERAGLAAGDLTHILLTHAHVDHYGGLPRLRPLTDAKIGVHELDVQTIAHHDARLAILTRRLGSFLAEAGLSAEAREQLLGIYRMAKSMYESVPVDFTYEAGDMRFGEFRMIHLPGHCAGHVAMRLDDVVFGGDMVVQGVTPHLTPESINPFGGMSHYLDSLHRLQRWARDARLVLNGHDDVITDLPAQVEATRRNMIRRMSAALAAMDEPRTIAEISRAVYGEMSGYHELLITEKTGAYVEYFFEHGMIGLANPAEVERGEPARYYRLREIPETEILPRERDHVLI